jgi:guanylate kinase
MRSSAENVRDQEIIQRRLKTASREIEDYREYDYILVNDDLERSTEALKAIIMTERRKHAGGEPTAEEREMTRLADARQLVNVHDRIQPILTSFAPESAIRK